jgi:tetratricopeptide (TPR) repeat protein
MARFGVIAIASLTVGLGLASPVIAQEENPAEAAFQKGRALLAERRYREACESFERSQREDPASGTLLALAYCQELSGLIASALVNYRAAAELAQVEGQDERRDAAMQQSKTLADRVSVLTIRVPSGIAETPGLRVTLDGAELGRARFGTPIPLDGGTYRVEAVLGDTTWSTTVTLQGERDKKSLVVELVLPSQNSAPPASVPPAAPVAAQRADTSDSSATLRAVALGLGVAGVACFGVGTGFGIAANSKNQASKRDGHCDDTGCDARGVELRNDAFTYAHLSNGFFLAGGVLALGGAALYFGTALGSNESSSRVEANVTPAGGRIVFTETF